MKNDYEIRGNVTAIFLNKKDGSILEALISTEDLAKVQEFPNTWYAGVTRADYTAYVVGWIQRSDRSRIHSYLHRWILDTPEGLVVDHINHDGLDNRRENLRIATKGDNQHNRKGAQRNNKSSGIRGVSWHKKTQKWQAQIKLNGKKIYLGLYKDLNDAKHAAEEGRAKYMPYSKEAGWI
ncbi:pathogenesis-related transcriptional factor and ERF protein [Desmospora sp. 8437]|nr:pathogenesis-related transcriptional factor and ERF protein [Desmospora sp. 8437]